jgi:hypothetical protein
MFCPECGFDADEARFCPDCGTGLDQFRVVAGEADLGVTAESAPRSALRTTGSRGRSPARASQPRSPKPQSQPGRAQPTRSRPAHSARPARISPAIIWMSFAAIAVIVVVGVFALTRTQSGASNATQSAGQAAGPIAADTSGSYSVLVQRANGLYDQGAQAFQKKQQSAGEQYFAAAAKVYAAAWKQQATDPNVGTDYATSLFYSGDGAGALKQVNVVLAGSPEFQTAHLNKGVYLQTASQDAQQSGQKAKADSLLAQAKTEFQKAVSIDPGSSAGAKAAANLKTL